MGGLTGVVVLLLIAFPGYNFGDMEGGRLLDMRVLLVGIILLSGLAGTARLYLRMHEPLDVWGGYLVGFTAQFIAARFILS